METIHDLWPQPWAVEPHGSGLGPGSVPAMADPSFLLESSFLTGGPWPFLGGSDGSQPLGSAFQMSP